MKTTKFYKGYHIKFYDDYSKDELNLAIQACIEIGETVGCIVN